MNFLKSLKHFHARPKVCPCFWQRTICLVDYCISHSLFRELICVLFDQKKVTHTLLLSPLTFFCVVRANSHATTTNQNILRTRLGFFEVNFCEKIHCNLPISKSCISVFFWFKSDKSRFVCLFFSGLTVEVPEVVVLGCSTPFLNVFQRVWKGNKQRFADLLFDFVNLFLFLLVGHSRKMNEGHTLPFGRVKFCFVTEVVIKPQRHTPFEVWFWVSLLPSLMLRLVQGDWFVCPLRLLQEESSSRWWTNLEEYCQWWQVLFWVLGCWVYCLLLKWDYFWDYFVDL